MQETLVNYTHTEALDLVAWLGIAVCDLTDLHIFIRGTVTEVRYKDDDIAQHRHRPVGGITDIEFTAEIPDLVET